MKDIDKRWLLGHMHHPIQVIDERTVVGRGTPRIFH
jgi:hypothetical protein